MSLNQRRERGDLIEVFKMYSRSALLFPLPLCHLAPFSSTGLVDHDGEGRRGIDVFDRVGGGGVRGHQVRLQSHFPLQGKSLLRQRRPRQRVPHLRRNGRRRRASFKTYRDKGSFICLLLSLTILLPHAHAPASKHTEIKARRAVSFYFYLLWSLLKRGKDLNFIII